MNRDAKKCANSGAVNPCIARKMGHRNHISCNNNDLNLEGKIMGELNGELNEICERINGTSAAVRNSCKVSVALRNEVSLENPRLSNIRAKEKFTICQ